jgi:Mlc titration factor MtfA (ptsG expression regulator)
MNLFKRFRRWRQARKLCQSRVPIELWDRVTEDALAHFHLSHQELHRLRELTSLFLQAKAFSAADGMELNDYREVIIASQACLLILNLDLDYYDGWHEIIVYPDSFYVEMSQPDEIGLVHEQRVLLGGEAWGTGPVILSWRDARPGNHIHGKGSNVILHEFAHKLDMLNGVANGMPPLHPDMPRAQWTAAFSHTFEHLVEQVERHHRTRIDPYGAENPAEFFAVISEEFFEVPERIHHYYPDVYHQLKLFYRQDPLARQVRAGRHHED